MRAVVLLVLVACVAAAAPAAASERSEARRYAKAMQPRITLTPAEADAIVADPGVRSSRIASTCMPTVREAASDENRRPAVVFVYVFHAYDAYYRRLLAWLREAEERLATIPTRSPALRRGRAERARGTRILDRVLATAGGDFCAILAAWQATGWAEEPPASKAATALLAAPGGAIRRATRVFRRHGATRAQRRAFAGQAAWPALEFPESDPVADALGAEVRP
jgi:hypothetical protein